jgi:hypothetical protein
VAAARAATIALSKKTALVRKRTATSKATTVEAVEAEAVETVRPRSRASGCQEDPPSGAQLGAALRLSHGSLPAPAA